MIVVSRVRCADYIFIWFVYISAEAYSYVQNAVARSFTVFILCSRGWLRFSL